MLECPVAIFSRTGKVSTPLPGHTSGLDPFEPSPVNPFFDQVAVVIRCPLHDHTTTSQDHLKAQNITSIEPHMVS